MANFTKGATLAVYKEKAALNIQFAPAKANDKGYLETGGFMLAFAPANGESGGAKYLWDNAIRIMLDVNETTRFIRMLKEEVVEGKQHTSIYHDPDKGTPQENTRAKKLYTGQARDGGKFLNIDSAGNRVSVVLSADEISYISTAMGHAIPGCLGWTFESAAN